MAFLQARGAIAAPACGLPAAGRVTRRQQRLAPSRAQGGGAQEESQDTALTGEWPVNWSLARQGPAFLLFCLDSGLTQPVMLAGMHSRLQGSSISYASPSHWLQLSAKVLQLEAHTVFWVYGRLQLTTALQQGQQGICNWKQLALCVPASAEESGQLLAPPTSASYLCCQIQESTCQELRELSACPSKGWHSVAALLSLYAHVC